MSRFLPFLSLFSTNAIHSESYIASEVESEADPNIVGALLFFSYILAALFFSIYVILSIIRTPLTGPHDDHSKHGQNSTLRTAEKRGESMAGLGVTWIFAALAVASFSVLSWNMLHFLIVSYTTWISGNNLAGLPQDSMLQQLKLQTRFIWMWAVDSNLFQAFAQDLIVDPVKWNTVSGALIYSYTWNSWMSSLGHRYDIPALWAYFALDQILPISFTQNLFCLVLLKTSLHGGPHSNASSWANTVLGLRLTGVVCYVMLLYLMPLTIDTRWFFPTLFSLRLLLFTPYLVDHIAFRNSTSRSDSATLGKLNFNVILLTGSIIIGVLLFIRIRTTNDDVPSSKPVNYAAAALSDDMVIGLASSLVLFLWTRKQAS